MDHHQNVICASPHCHKLLCNNLDGLPPYSIIKCGHIYHGSCFENVKRDKFCPKCQVVFNPRQCYKINLNSSDNEEDFENFDNKLNEFYQWMFYDSRTDVDTVNLQEFACPMGKEQTGLSVYVARAFYNDDILPAYFEPKHKRVFAIFENEVPNFTGDIDILDIHNDKHQAQYEWVECYDGSKPNNAFVTGETSTGNSLYTIRSEHQNKTIYGMLDATKEEAQVIVSIEEPAGKILYKVINKKKYEVLVREPQTMHANRLQDM